MYVVRPPGIHGTPRQVADELGFRLRKFPNPAVPDRVFDYSRDFLMTPVPPANLRNVSTPYYDTFAFATRNKYGQRRALETAGIPVPSVAATHEEAGRLAGTRFVARPLRHSRGVGYRVTSDRSDFTPGREYISELYPKRREYRIIFVRGEPLIFLRKKPHEGVDETQPWGHENSRFQTINDVAGSRIGGTDAAAVLSRYPVIKGAHIAAVDILYNNRDPKPWVALEINFCPGLDIDNNRARVVEYIRSGRVGRMLPTEDQSWGAVRVTPSAPVAPPPPNPRIAEIRRALEVSLARRNIVANELDSAEREVVRKRGELSNIDQERDRLERELGSLT
jgi:hypothetical protein